MSSETDIDEKTDEIATVDKSKPRFAIIVQKPIGIDEIFDEDKFKQHELLDVWKRLEHRDDYMIMSLEGLEEEFGIRTNTQTKKG